MMKSVQNLGLRIAVGVTLMATAASAMAGSGNGFQGVAQRFSALGDAATQTVVYVCLALGLVAFAFAGKKMWDKANDRDDVKMGAIVWPMLGGAFLMSLFFVARLTVETLGGSASEFKKTN